MTAEVELKWSQPMSAPAANAFTVSGHEVKSVRCSDDGMTLHFEGDWPAFPEWPAPPRRVSRPWGWFQRMKRARERALRDHEL